ncbi:hypothetical protein QBA57_28695 [Streptomyces scabiei]|uniref:hypothetical protein n=1 Tax=Streptomyces scabiei TaxID=1930 RepID=UPI001B3433AF|nr:MULTISPECIES: hypothetical protein [Streptomyces]MBP5883153.1 hypothetical protein [Streptomyces sp. LBUM 1487]MDX2628605.1 hypothetical protein [Streptomyces scabiei]MDX3162729.1 hypothetical protein [Streptomyces scabiei]
MAEFTPQLTDEQREQLLRSVAAVSAALQELVEACLPAVQAAAQQFAQITQALQAAGYLDEDGKPVKRPDRPAWQSPYGPAPRRR